MLGFKNFGKIMFGSFMANYYQNKENRCCGIIGIISTKDNADKVCLEGIQLLQNRGYDSAGIVTFNQHNMIMSKLASDQIKKVDCVEKLKEIVPQKHKGCFSGMGHTRWATCGGKTDLNSHPHYDQDERIFLIHNGTLDDVQNWRQYLLDQNVRLSSDTDSELIVQLISLRMKKNLSLFDATKQILSEISGSWGLLIIDKENPDQMVVSRNGSPIQIGYNEEAIYIASEIIAFQKYTNNYISLQNDEIILLDLKNRNEFYKNIKERTINIKYKTEIQLQPKYPYTSFFQQEIEEQPESILKCLGNGSRLTCKSNNEDFFSQEIDCTKLGGFEKYENNIVDIKNLIIIACGSSLYAGQIQNIQGRYAINFFKKLECFNTIQAFDAAEFENQDIPQENSGALFISQSGETRDIYMALKVCKQKGIFCIGITNTVGSQIASEVNCGIFQNVGREIAVAASKSFTSQIVVLILAAIWISYKKNIVQLKCKRQNLKNLLRQLPVTMGETLMVVDNACKKVAEILKNEKSLMVLAKGIALPIAQEGVLKIKEINYIHAQAYMAAEMKHGPIALIDSENPNSSKIILIILDDHNKSEMELALSEVKSRQAFTIVITNCLQKLNQNHIDFVIQINNLDQLTSLLCVVVFQKISSYIAIFNNINPDKPRNLAKTVTV